MASELIVGGAIEGLTDAFASKVIFPKFSKKLGKGKGALSLTDHGAMNMDLDPSFIPDNNHGKSMLRPLKSGAKKGKGFMQKAAPAAMLGFGIYNITKNSKQDQQMGQMSQQMAANASQGHNGPPNVVYF